MSARSRAKYLLGGLPLAAELYWLLFNPGKKPFSRFNLETLKARLPQLVADVKPHSESAPSGKKVFFFASSHYWIMHTTLCGLALRGLGHDVTLGYLPFSDYNKSINRFDLRLQDLYARSVFEKAQPVLKAISFLGLKPARKIPAALARALEQVTAFDTPSSVRMSAGTSRFTICGPNATRRLPAWHWLTLRTTARMLSWFPMA
jgi:hypothetical protein